MRLFVFLIISPIRLSPPSVQPDGRTEIITELTENEIIRKRPRPLPQTHARRMPSLTPFHPPPHLPHAGPICLARRVVAAPPERGAAQWPARLAQPPHDRPRQEAPDRRRRRDRRGHGLCARRARDSGCAGAALPRRRLYTTMPSGGRDSSRRGGAARVLRVWQALGVKP